MFQRTFLGALLFCCAASLAAAGELPRYQIQATLDTALKTITATQRVTFTNNTSQPMSDVYFHVYSNRQYTPLERSFMLRYASYFKVDPPPHFTENHFKISRLQVDALDASFSFEGKDQTLLRIPLKTPLAAGASTTVAMDFTLTVPHSFGRFGWYQDIMALARWYPILSVWGPQGWDQSPFYPFHRPFFSDASLYTVDVTVPAANTVIHSGDLINETIDGNNKKLHIETPKPIREFAMAISPSYHAYEADKDGITFKAYYLDGNIDHAKLAVKDAQDLMAYYTKRFGPYPYRTFSIAPVHLAYGGEQMSNMIFIDTRVFELPRFLDRYFDFLVAHETGHQWFYNLIGVDDYTQMWLEEGINSYFLMEYISDKYGPDAKIVELPPWAKILVPELSFRRAQDVRYKMSTRFGFEQPVIDKLSSFKEPSSIFTFTYGKGSRVLQMLKYLVGNEAFERIFRKIFEQYSFKNLDIEDFKRIAQEESSKDLTGFFEQWLYTIKTLDVRVERIKGRSIFVSRRGISMPTDVDIHYKDGSQDHMIWRGVREKDILTAPLDKPISLVTLDPNKELLDIDRVNNSLPRKIHMKFVPLYHGLYDIPVFLPDDGYNWVTGPTIADGIGMKTSFQKPYDYNVYAQSGYNPNNKFQITREGIEIKNILHSQTTFGVEAMQRVDDDNGEDDLNSQKVYLRRELWPAPYSLTDINDHMTLYAIRNRTPSGSFFSSESIRNTSYLKHNEAIIGTVLHLDRAGPHPDMRQGYVADLLVENSGHWAGATQTFTRASIDTSFYHPVIGESKMAYRLKYGWGSSDDKNLFELGGPEGLRGFDRKTIRGANALLGSTEYRFPLLDNLHLNTYDHALTLNKISGVVFFDAGRAWYDHYEDTHFHKDVGAGLRFHVSIGSFLENVMVRLDVAHAIAESKQDTHAWMGIDQAF
ncbi:MAG: BamA/TamA family outer membrane protein [Candidatus Omnitrophica bacterium]|nr:BamA/TamA family outer membrane protein [Candidatus Omnitrophota bacterium]